MTTQTGQNKADQVLQLSAVTAIAQAIVNSKPSNFILELLASYKKQYPETAVNGLNQPLTLMTNQGQEADESNEKADLFPDTVLIAATRLADIKIMNALLDLGVDPNQDNDVTTPMETACQGGEIEKIDLLLKKGAVKPNRGCLRVALKNDKSDICLKTFQHILKINPELCTPQLVAWLIQLSDVEDNECFPIFVRPTLIKVISYSLDQLSNLQGMTDGTTGTHPVELFYQNFRFDGDEVQEILGKFLAKGISIDAQYGEDQKTLIMMAAENNDTKIVTFLMNQNPKPNLTITDSGGETVADYINPHNTDMLRLLDPEYDLNRVKQQIATLESTLATLQSTIAGLPAGQRLDVQAALMALAQKIYPGK